MKKEEGFNPLLFFFFPYPSRIRDKIYLTDTYFDFMAGQKVKVKIGKWHVIAILVAVGTVTVFLVASSYFKPVPDVSGNGYVIDYAGTPMAFRADPREADLVQAVPSEGEVQRVIFKPSRTTGPNGEIVIRQPLKNVTIVFSAKGVSQKTLGWYTVEVAEIINKLTALYQGRYNVKVNFITAEVEDYGALKGQNLAPIVALVHPDIANGTFVSVDSVTNVITVSGGDSLKDFDLATVKFMMIALGIDVDQTAV